MAIIFLLTANCCSLDENTILFALLWLEVAEVVVAVVEVVELSVASGDLGGGRGGRGRLSVLLSP